MPLKKQSKTNKVLSVVEHSLPSMVVGSIKDGDDFNHAVEVLSQLNRKLDMVVEEREKVTVPLLAALKAERERFKPYETKLSDAIEMIRKEMSSYKMKLDAANRSVQKKVAEDVASGRIGVDKAVGLMSAAASGTIQGRVETASGAVRFRVDKVVRIVEAEKIPRRFLIEDMAAIKKALTGGEDVPGAVLEEVQTVVNSR